MLHPGQITTPYHILLCYTGIVNKELLLNDRHLPASNKKRYVGLV